MEFLITSLLIILVPVVSVAVTNAWVKEDPNISELNKVIIAIAPSVVFINVVMGVYVYRAIKDPENYQRDEPVRMVRPKKE